MSAASPKVQDKASDSGQEPSMEEILASIRRIIADDQVAKSEEKAPAPSTPPENDDILDLAEVAQPIRKAAAPIVEAPVSAREQVAPDLMDFDSISFDDPPEPDFDPVWDEPLSPEPAAPESFPPESFAPEPPAPQPPRHEVVHDVGPEPANAGARLTSAVTDASVGQAFAMLSSTVLNSNARTLEDLVQDMLRPMLKSWLDDNLPVMVERLVRAEIERVARGR